MRRWEVWAKNVCCPRHADKEWHLLSRHWTRRRAVQEEHRLFKDSLPMLVVVRKRKGRQR